LTQESEVLIGVKFETPHGGGELEKHDEIPGIDLPSGPRPIHSFFLVVPPTPGPVREAHPAIAESTHPHLRAPPSREPFFLNSQAGAEVHRHAQEARR
jgi:hypothetical protein